MKKNVRVAPSILASDFSRLGEEVQAITKAGADFIHIDVMDGHFVPNITLGPSIVKAIRDRTDLPFDVHLMISPVDPHVESFAKAGANILTAHPEAGPHLHRTIQLIKLCSAKAGVSLNPSTPAELIGPIINDVDLVLVMSVNPGFGGQMFLPNTLEKISIIRQMIDTSGRDIDLAVDGGITAETGRLAVEAGADMLVAGTAIFAGGPKRYSDNIKALRESS
jgi:ribulose-phosphate 3-epimerase